MGIQLLRLQPDMNDIRWEMSILSDVQVTAIFLP